MVAVKYLQVSFFKPFARAGKKGFSSLSKWPAHEGYLTLNVGCDGKELNCGRAHTKRDEHFPRDETEREDGRYSRDAKANQR